MAYLWWGVSRSSGVAKTPRPSVERIRQRRLLGALERVVQELLDAGRDLVLLLVGQVGVLAQPAAEALDRVVRGPASNMSFGT